MKKKKREFPNNYVIIFAIILICAAATWFVPGGEYSTQSGTVTYQSVDSVPQTWQVLTALFKGFTKQAGIIFFILIIGASFWVVNSGRAIDAGIFSFLNWSKRLEKNKFLRKIGVNNIIMILIMLLFSLFGAVFGMSEETIAFIVILVPLAVSMGYDSIVGVCLVYVAAHVGFAGAFLNPFTIGIAQNLADVQMFSGIEYRFFCWMILTLLMITFVLLYARKVKKNPKSSIMYEADSYWRERVEETFAGVQYYKNRSSKIAFAVAFAAIIGFTALYYKECVITLGAQTFTLPSLLWIVAALFGIFSIIALRKSVHFFVLNLLIFTIVYLIIGVLGFQWYISEISALFLSLGVLSGISLGYSANNIVKELLNGAKDILSAALIVGVAAGIIIVLQDGKVMDSILHAMASGLGESGKLTSLSLMYGIQTILNLFIPSATAKAAITIPIMAPFSDMINLSRQATIVAFQFGDGFTNMITPTSGVLMAVLGLSRIPYAKWFKWIWKFILLLIIFGFLLLIPTVLMELPGF